MAAAGLLEGSGCGREVVVRLENQELWRRFNEIGTEMIITKTGRWVNVTQLLAPPNVANLLHFYKIRGQRSHDHDQG